MGFRCAGSAQGRRCGAWAVCRSGRLADAPADFAAVAIVALTQDEHADKIYHLTGPQPLTHREQMQLIGKALGRPLRYEELDEEQARAAISPYAPADMLFETWRQQIGTPAPAPSKRGPKTSLLISGRKRQRRKSQ